ncbi:CDP-diacylglycerol--serine O-phosphatidyltransferase [Candidatus Woesearchaeota archaeon]|nr:CDP-diacylglycerol--serine O-phosphatidyltransferase [Candidatus Woesearchaeota archaeon]
MKGRKSSLTLMLLRILLSFIVFILIYNSRKRLSLYLFVLTAFAAFLDGFLAKRGKSRSHLRSIVDPFADKLLINLAAIALFLKGLLPFWIMIIYLSKDLLVVCGALFVLIKNAKTTFRTNVIDKISVFIQLFTLFTVLMGHLDYVLVWISVVFVVVSFIVTLFRSGIEVASYETDLEEIRFRKLLRLPDLFTFMNICMGLTSILLVINGEYFFSVFALLFAVFFDYLDGKVARMIKRTGDFGKQLDSMADTISFGVAPAIFGFSLIQTNFALIVFALFLFAGVLRLARYNIMEFTGEFAGMPITVSGIVIPLIYLAKVPVFVYPYIYLFLAILMVSPLKVKKLF